MAHPNRWVTQNVLWCGVLLLAGFGNATKVDLKPATAEAFDRYVHKAEARMEPGHNPFLWVDASPDRLHKVRDGKVVSAPWSGDGDIDVPDGLIHDWVGAVFIPGATLDKTLALVEDYNNHKKYYKPEVVDSKLMSHNGDNFKVHLRLLKKQVITVVLDTDHDVRYTRLSPTRCVARSYSTRIAEVENAGKKDEHDLEPGHDHGFMWRLNSYWRYEERDGGVYVECEAISLTRSVPTGLGWLINPIIHNLPKDSLAGTLRETRDAVIF